MGAAGACCSDLGVQHYGMADEIEFLENYKTHVASTVIMMQVWPVVGVPPCCMLFAFHVVWAQAYAYAAAVLLVCLHVALVEGASYTPVTACCKGTLNSTCNPCTRPCKLCTAGCRLRCHT